MSGKTEHPKSVEEREASAANELAATLLHAPIEEEPAKRRWVYPTWALVLVSLFLLYHATILLVHNLPSKGLSEGVHTWFNKTYPIGESDETPAGAEEPTPLLKVGIDMRTYMAATGNTQSWAMFAPNPHRSNVFMKVMVEDSDGEVWDMAHDIYGRRSYPYMFYDRMGKINRRIIDQRGYRRHYAAWVCREWERTHEGEAPKEVQFVKMWTRIPPPEKVIDDAGGNPFRMGYDPMELELFQRNDNSIKCRNTRHAQLPNQLRERYGFPLLEHEEKVFRSVSIRTWWDRKKSAERAEKAKVFLGDRLPGGKGGSQ